VVAAPVAVAAVFDIVMMSRTGSIPGFEVVEVTRRVRHVVREDQAAAVNPLGGEEVDAGLG
jgi:hypothetical protein